MTRAAILASLGAMTAARCLLIPKRADARHASPVTSLAAAAAIFSLESSIINHVTIQESRPPESKVP